MLDEQLENELRMREDFVASQVLLAAEANRSGDSTAADRYLQVIAAQRREIDDIKRLLRRIP